MRRFTDVPVVGISDVGAAAAQSFNRRQLTKSAGQCGESERLAAGGTPASPFRAFCRPRRSLPESGIPPILAISAETGHALSTGRAMELEVEGICLRNYAEIRGHSPENAFQCPLRPIHLEEVA